MNSLTYRLFDPFSDDVDVAIFDSYILLHYNNQEFGQTFDESRILMKFYNQPSEAGFGADGNFKVIRVTASSLCTVVADYIMSHDRDTGDKPALCMLLRKWII